MDYSALTEKIIANLEGGYYHPEMKANLKNGDRMGNSGETLYGMDKVNGGADITTSANGQKFWALVDSIYGNHHADTSYYNNKPTGANATTLKNLACEMMKARYVLYSTLYLSSASKAIINKYPSLQLNFFYSCWNGGGNFKKFATDFNNAVKAGTTKEADLITVCYNSRKKYLPSTAEKVLALMNANTSGSNKKIFLILAAVGLGLYLINKNS